MKHIVIKNVSSEPLTVVELGNTVVAPGDELDLCDQTAEHHYRSWLFARKALYELTGTSLFCGLHDDPPTIAVRITNVDDNSPVEE
jgi:hypothetical protein